MTTIPDTPATTGRVRGDVIRARLEWVREHGDREQVIEFFEALAPQVRHHLPLLGETRWYSATLLVQVDDAINDIFGSLCMEAVGACLARRTLGSLRRFFRHEMIHDFFRTAVLLHWPFAGCDSPEYVEASPGHGVIRHRGATPFHHALHCAAMRGFYAEIARMHGVSEVEVDEPSCRGTGSGICRFDVRWS